MANQPNLLKVETSPPVETEGAIEVETQPSPEQKERREEKEMVAEAAPELSPEEKQKEEELLEKAEELAPVVQPEPPQPKDPVLTDLEGILAEDLGEIYNNLPEDKKPLFKQKGEEVAGAVKQMIDSGKVRVKNILKLIKEWLQLIPGVNKFFLEQEAKIKTDNIAEYIEANQGKGQDQL